MPNFTKNWNFCIFYGKHPLCTVFDPPLSPLNFWAGDLFLIVRSADPPSRPQKFNFPPSPPMFSMVFEPSRKVNGVPGKDSDFLYVLFAHISLSNNLLFPRISSFWRSSSSAPVACHSLRCHCCNSTSMCHRADNRTRCSTPWRWSNFFDLAKACTVRTLERCRHYSTRGHCRDQLWMRDRPGRLIGFAVCLPKLW